MQRSAMRRKRPLGFTLLAFWFGFLTLALVRQFANSVPASLEPGSLALRFLGICILVLSALVVLGLWKVEPWVATAMDLWVAAALAFALGQVLESRGPRGLADLEGWVVFGVMGLVMYVPVAYVKTAFTRLRSAPAAP